MVFFSLYSYLWGIPKTCMCRMISVVFGNDQCSGSDAAVLESTGSKGSVLVNGLPVDKNTIITLYSGDEVVFDVVGNHLYVSF